MYHKYGNINTCYFNDIIKIEDFDPDNILIDENHIRFNKIDGFIRAYDGTRYLVLFRSEKYDSIYNRIRYIISVKSGITYIISHNHEKTKVTSYNSLPLEKNTFHNLIILIKSVFTKDENNYYYNIFLEKGSYELPKK